MLFEHEFCIRIEAEISFGMAAFGRAHAAHHGCE